MFDLTSSDTEAFFPFFDTNNKFIHQEPYPARLVEVMYYIIHMKIGTG